MSVYQRPVPRTQAFRKHAHSLGTRLMQTIEERHTEKLHIQACGYSMFIDARKDNRFLGLHGTSSEAIARILLIGLTGAPYAILMTTVH